MKKIFTTLLILIACATLLSAQVTKEQADAIVGAYLQSEALQSEGILYANVNVPCEEGISITTSNEETVRAKYACWTYCLNENELLQRRYFFVKESDGNLLELIANADVSELGSSWTIMAPTGLTELKENSSLPYPNPVDDWLIVPCSGENTRVEIYDLSGSRLFSGLLSDKDSCQLNVSFLNAGIYIISVDGESFKITKK